MKKNELLASPSALALTLASVAVRLLPHPPNFTPLGASALFGGAKIKRPWNYLAPLFVLFLTDLIIGFHGTMPFVYGSFILTTWLAERYLNASPSLLKIGAFGAGSSLLFFLVTNFGVWAEGLLYTRNLAGLVQAYLMGLPFLRNMLMADLLFSVGVFAAYRQAEKSLLLSKVDRRLASWLGWV